MPTILRKTSRFEAPSMHPQTWPQSTNEYFLSGMVPSELRKTRACIDENMTNTILAELQQQLKVAV